MEQARIEHAPNGSFQRWRAGEKHAICLKDYRLQSWLSIQYVHGDLFKHLGIDSRTDHPDRYSNLFLNAYINRHVHAKYLKMI